MDLATYRQTDAEQARTADILGLVPAGGRRALDIGARDGHFSRRLAERFDEVVALDLQAPAIQHPRIASLAGDITQLPFDDGTFDFVLCSEVLEHIPPAQLALACREVARVASSRILIGVPYKQDLRIERTTCLTCGKRNPPNGHVNSFDEVRLTQLFAPWPAERSTFVGQIDTSTNAVAAWLMDLAGNPFGVYGQDEPCIHCGAPLRHPPPRTILQRALTRTATWCAALSAPFHPPHANWIHMLFRKDAGVSSSSRSPASA